MPSWKIHLIFDLIFVIVILISLYGQGWIKDPFLILFLLLFNLLATIFPDIDTPKSNIRKYVSLILAVVLVGYLIINFSVTSVVSSVVIFVFIYLVFRFFPTKHRGITHTLWFSLVISSLLTFLLWLMFEFSGFEFGLYFLVIIWGYLSHLILDKTT